MKLDRLDNAWISSGLVRVNRNCLFLAHTHSTLTDGKDKQAAAVGGGTHQEATPVGIPNGRLQVLQHLCRPSPALYDVSVDYLSDTSVGIFVRTKGLPLSQTSLYEVHPDDVKLTVPFGWNEEQKTDVPMTPVVVFIVSILVYRALQSAYHNQFLTQEKA